MTNVPSILSGAGAIVFFVWMFLIPSKQGNQDAPIDPDDARTLGTLIGLSGGTITDAVMARYALQRFEELHGRKATVREMAIVAGMMRGK